MTLTTAVSRQYRLLTDRALSAEWSRLAAAYLAVSLATALSSIYIELLAHSEDGSDTFTVDIGLESALDAVVQGLAVGAVVAPVLFAVFAVLTRVLPVRRVYAQTVVPWVLACPVGLVAFLGLVMFNGDAQIARALFDGYPWVVAEWAFMWAAHTTLLVAFIGGAYALSTRSVSLSRAQKRALVVAIVVLVAVPIGVGAAFPTDDNTDDEYDHDSQANSETDTLEDADDDTDDGSLTDEELYGGPLTDPETYDNDHYTPRIENATALPNESDDVAVLPVAEADRPAANESASYPIGAVHADATNVSVSNIELEVDGETVVPKGHYHVTIDGVDESTAYQLGSYWAYNETTVGEGGHAFAGSGPYAGLEGGFYVTMEQTESAHIYFDVVTEDGEIHRYIVNLERTDLSSTA